MIKGLHTLCDRKLVATLNIGVLPPWYKSFIKLSLPTAIAFFVLIGLVLSFNVDSNFAGVEPFKASRATGVHEGGDKWLTIIQNATL